MNAPVRWRPLAQSDLYAACTMMEKSIAQWRDDWFGSSGAARVCVTPVRIVSKTDPWSGPQLSRIQNSDSVWWRVDKEAARTLAAMALDLTQGEAKTVSDATCPPFAMLGERIVHELSLALASVQGGIRIRSKSVCKATCLRWRGRTRNLSSTMHLNSPRLTPERWPHRRHRASRVRQQRARRRRKTSARPPMRSRTPRLARLDSRRVQPGCFRIDATD